MSDFKTTDITDDDGIEFINLYDDNYDDDFDDDDFDLRLEELDDIADSTAGYKKQKDFKTMVLSEIFSYVKIIIFAVVLALIFTNFVIINARVPTGSMRDTIWEGDRLIGLRLSYTFSSPKRGDIVIFKFPDDESEIYVKRVIGTPNDVVQIKEGKVFVNGEELDEPYIKDYILDDGNEYTYIVPDGCYFMLGDNRNNSKDSRFWNNTYVRKEKIIAKVMFRYYSGEHKRVTFSLLK